MKARRILVPVRQSLRTYWGTAVLLAAAGAAALAVLVPAAALVGPGAGLPARLAVPPAGGADLGVAWGEFVRTPDAIRASAVTSLSHLLFGVAAGVVAVTWLTTLSLSTARATARAGEVVIRRAVGATRLNLLLSALLEGGAIAAAALVIGGATGLVAARVALGAWPGAAGPAAAGPGIQAVILVLAGIVLGALLSLAAARPGARLVVAEEAPFGLAVPVINWVSASRYWSSGRCWAVALRRHPGRSRRRARYSRSRPPTLRRSSARARTPPRWRTSRPILRWRWRAWEARARSRASARWT